MLHKGLHAAGPMVESHRTKGAHTVYIVERDLDMDDRVLVAHMVAYIEGHLVEPIGADELATRSGYSLNRLRQKFYAVTGETPSGYLRKRRLTEAAKEILGGARPLDAALKYGYSSQDNFITAFRSFFGVTPSEIARIDDKYKRFIRSLREAYSIMEIANLRQPPFHATLMGCVKGAADCFDADWSVPMLYGLTGHAFLINVHKDLCPSGPYVWNMKRFRELLEGIGIATPAEYGIGRDTPEPERLRIEKQLKEHLDDGKLCMLDFLEHQLISGYDERGFVMLQPWGGKAGSEIKALTFGTWEECFRKEGWAHFTLLSKRPIGKSETEAARDALAYALELFENPGRYEVEGYRIGAGAYGNWISCVERGMGSSHGHWWNAMVWSECRGMAAAFFRELGELTDVPGARKSCADLAALYKTVADDLMLLTDRKMAAPQQLTLLKDARDVEAGAAKPLRELAATL